jgi:large subunit ribosomal protein L9
MRVILTEVINKLGKIGEVVKVNNGYAKNFLIPKKKAICFTDANFRVFESKRTEYEKLNFKNLDLANKVKIKIEGKNIIIIQNASDDGRLYGSEIQELLLIVLMKSLAKNQSRVEKFFLKNQLKKLVYTNLN